jgi:hypothetical protein
VIQEEQEKRRKRNKPYALLLRIPATAVSSRCGGTDSCRGCKGVPEGLAPVKRARPKEQKAATEWKCNVPELMAMLWGLLYDDKECEKLPGTGKEKMEED